MRTFHYSRQFKKARLKLARLFKNKATHNALVLLLRVGLAIASPAILAECQQLSDPLLFDQGPDQTIDHVAQVPPHHETDG